MRKSWRFIGLTAGVLIFAWAAAPANAQFFFTDTTIGPRDTNYDGSDIVAFGCTLTVDGAHTFSDVLLADGATLTHSLDTNSMGPGGAPGGLNLVIKNDFVVDAGCVVTADGRNFGGQGPGGSVWTNDPFGGVNDYWSGGGGGHGGAGGLSLGEAPGGNAYGTPLSMKTGEMGSEGGAGYGPGGAGGGLVHLKVGGVVLVNGVISADGADATNSAAGGGSGGSIWISANSMAGSGRLSVKGGAGEPSAGGGGGGGRIVIECQTNGFTGAFTASGGPGEVAGGAGTVFVTNGPAGFLLVDNGGLRGTNTPIVGGQGLNLIVTGGAVAAAATQDPLSVGSLSIGSNSWITIERELGVQPILHLNVAGDAVVQGGGGIDVSDFGFANGVGDGRFGPPSGTNIAGGGGYGGAGGGPGLGGQSSGYEEEATSPGFPGAASASSPAAPGGGCLAMTVGGTLEMNGGILANGGTATGSIGGGGSGGGVSLLVGTFAGTGLISARGGAGTSTGGGGGGGGRIFVNFLANSFTGTFAAHGGGGAYPGGAGTVDLAAGKAPVQLIVDNGGLLGTNTLLSDTQFGNVSITGGAAAVSSADSLGFSNLLIGAGSSFSVSSSAVQWTARNLELDDTGAILLDGVSQATTAQGGSPGGGGGNGGAGGASAHALGGRSIGGYLLPSGPGSRGGEGLDGGFAPGGGELRLAVSNLVLNGRISANGSMGGLLGGGGGSGGSILIYSTNLSGNGVVSAHGGAGDLSANGGGGGGGRIYIFAATNQFTGMLVAHGGVGFQSGGAGAIYITKNRPGVPLSPDQLIIDNAGVTNAAVTAENLAGTELNLTVARGAILALTPVSFEIQSLVVGSNSVVTVGGSPGDIALLQFNIAGSLTVWPTGMIDMDGKGPGPGVGVGAGRSVTISNVPSGSGAGDGGYGGASGTGVAGGTVSGTVLEGQTGSGGGGQMGGAGGGTLVLAVKGGAEIDGTLTANGLPAGGQNSGGGSGGSVQLSAMSLTGNGLISANGGAGALPLGGGGAGGRIVLSANSNSFHGVLTAYGAGGANYGGAGTILVKTNQTLEGSSLLIVDNRGHLGTNTPLFQVNGGFNLIITNGAIVGPPNSELSGLFIASNSFLKTLSEPQVMEMNVTGPTTVQAGGGIIVVPFNNANLGQGAGGSTSLAGVRTGSGGGHGGYGGLSASGAPAGAPYGSITAPFEVGGNGGGGSGASNSIWGGFGGGAFRLTVAGPLQLDGFIDASGQPAPEANNGGGAGGSIYLTVNGLTGSGRISANGGGGGLPDGGGGAGGRIAIYASSNGFAGVYSAHGGPGYRPGGAGSIYFGAQNLQKGYPKLIIDNGGLPGTNTPVTVNYGSDLTVSGGARAVTGGPLTLGALLLGSGGVLQLTNASAANSAFNLTASSMTIQPGARLDCPAVLYGYTNGSGQFGTGLGVAAGSGGGHGGDGGGGASGLPGGGAADDLLHPQFAGAPGGLGKSFLRGFTPAGGGLKATISGLAAIDGFISANGADAPVGSAGGGGAGGGVWLTAGGMAGSGSITANGGAGDLPYGGGGGGGRIAVYATSNSFSGTFQARGGAGFVAGGAGTIFEQNRQDTPSLLVDNGGLEGTNTPLPGTNVSLLFAETDLHLTGGAVAEPTNSDPSALAFHSLLIDSNAVLTARGAARSRLVVSIGADALVGETGAINLDGEGELGGAGPGAGSWNKARGAGGGGGYGGAGGDSVFGAPGGPAYGSSNNPIDLGSGGGLPMITAGFSDGGGSFTLTVGGTLEIDGAVSANGRSGEFAGAGGGAGGSLLLEVGALTGSGKISAAGGPGDPDGGGGGGGGRIALYSLTNAFTGAWTVAGGPGNAGGEDGTLYLSTNAAPTPAAVAPAQISAGLESESGNLSLSWQGDSALTYQLEASTNLVDWQLVGPPIVGSNGVMKVTGASSGPAMFFRVVTRN